MAIRNLFCPEKQNRIKHPPARRKNLQDLPSGLEVFTPIEAGGFNADRLS